MPAIFEERSFELILTDVRSEEKDLEWDRRIEIYCDSLPGFVLNKVPALVSVLKKEPHHIVIVLPQDDYPVDRFECKNFQEAMMMLSHVYFCSLNSFNLIFRTHTLPNDSFGKSWNKINFPHRMEVRTTKYDRVTTFFDKDGKKMPNLPGYSLFPPKMKTRISFHL